MKKGWQELMHMAPATAGWGESDVYNLYPACGMVIHVSNP